MDPPAPFTSLGEHFAIDLPGARALFTTRRGGHSRGPYASLNLGLGTDDDREHVALNHSTLRALIGRDPAFVYQVHGTHVHRLSGPPAPERPTADGQLCTEPGRAPLVLVADCLPIVVATPGAVVVLHAGWRGLAGGIVAQGVRALRDGAAGGARAGAAVAAAIGPGAGGCCYEVGPEVHAAFASHGERVREGRRLDLKAIAAAELAACGVDAVHDIGLCTLCGDPDLLFSHRRSGGITGRQAGLAWLT